MLLSYLYPSKRLLHPSCLICRIAPVLKCYFSDNLEEKYTGEQKQKILEVINNADINTLSSYEISKARLRKIVQWKEGNGQMKTISDVEYIDSFSERTAVKLFNSILDGKPKEKQKTSGKIKGQILHPNLSESVVKNCKSVLTVYVSVNSVCWTQILKDKYELVDWQYFGIDYPEGKRFQITDILNIAWRITQQLPVADVYVMKAEATTLRAAGSDPNNPKVMAINLQKAQMVAMMVALINSRSYYEEIASDGEESDKDILKQRIYFLRPSLPYRLYGTLVGNERVSTDQTVEMLLRDLDEKPSDNSYVYVPESLKNMFRSQKELQKDMLGHCLLLSLTFMDLCIYRNQARIEKLLKGSNS